MSSASLFSMWSSTSLGSKLATIEELRIDLTSEGIECPGVLVVGAQSAGKSSVLERLTGIAFPRAENTCTRVPTIVQLQTDPNLAEPEAFVSRDVNFKDTKRCKTMKQIQEAILEQTACSISDDKPITDDPIHIRYIRPKGPVLTLIDLPGITHVDSKNEDFDIHKVTSAMVRKYVDNENMIVLVVIPANDDFGNSEALRIAQTFDKEGTRTIGVISKCDLVPEKSDIVQKVQISRENDIKLSLGFIAVCNRGPGDNEVLDISAAEDELFNNHPLLKELRPSERGYQALSAKIVALQSKRINEFLPEARLLVRRKVRDIEKSLNQLGTGPETDTDRRNYLGRGLREIEMLMGSSIRAARKHDPQLNIASKSLDLAQEFTKSIKSETPDFFADEMKEMLKLRMDEAKGYTLTNFLNYSVFQDVFVETFFLSTKTSETNDLDGCIGQSAEIFVDSVYELFIQTFKSFTQSTKMASHYPKLAESILEKMRLILLLEKQKVLTMVATLIAAEKIQTFTQNPNYISFITNVRKDVHEFRKVNQNEGLVTELQQRGYYHLENYEINEPMQTSDVGKVRLDFIKENSKLSSAYCYENMIMELQMSLQSYSEIMINRMSDVIPLLTFKSLIHDVQSSLQYTIQAQILDDELRSLFAEDLSIVRERQHLQARKKRLIMAEKKLSTLH